MGFGALIIGGFFMLVGWMVSSRLKSKFKEYSQVHLSKDLTGAEVARLMLADNGIHDVQVVSVEGQLTDHYNPATKTVNLSEGVFHGRNAAATAVAAHECGHADMLFSMPRLTPCCSFVQPWSRYRTSAPAY